MTIRRHFGAMESRKKNHQTPPLSRKLSDNARAGAEGASRHYVHGKEIPAYGVTVRPTDYEAYCDIFNQMTDAGLRKPPADRREWDYRLTATAIGYWPKEHEVMLAFEMHYSKKPEDKRAGWVRNKSFHDVYQRFLVNGEPMTPQLMHDELTGRAMGEL